MLSKIILSLSLLFIGTSSYAFESGTYVCNIMGIEMTYILKPNGRAKQMGGINGTIRGYWLDDDDAAIIIKNNQILEDKGNGKYIFMNMVPCEKIK